MRLGVFSPDLVDGQADSGRADGRPRAAEESAMDVILFQQCCPRTVDERFDAKFSWQHRRHCLRLHDSFQLAHALVLVL